MKKRTKETWLKALKETLKHLALSIIIVLLLSIIGFIFGHHPTGGYASVFDIVVAIFLTLLYGFLWSFLIALPLLIASFSSYFIINSKFKLSKKILLTILIYLFLGFSVPLFLLIPGAIGYYLFHNQDAGWGMLFGLALLKIYLILTISNYIFMYYKNRNLLKIKKK